MTERYTMTRRSMLIAVPAAAGIALLAACVPGADGRTAAPRRMLGVGFEDMTEGPDRLTELAGRLDEVRATDVSVVAGRVDWTAFPWEGHEDAWSSAVGGGGSGGTDLVAEAIAALATAADGTARAVTLVVDVLAPGLLEREPELAGVGVDGHVSDDFPSLTVLTRGRVADDLVALVGAIAERYRPVAVSLTELFLDDTTYGDDDLDDFREATGADDWPRTDDGDIDVDDERVVDWRCEAVAGLVSRARDAAAEHGVELWMEVRAPRTDASSDRLDSGQNYELLDAAADRLVMWDYFGIADAGSPSSKALSEAFVARLGDRAVMSPGLWAEDDDTITPDELRAAVEDAGRAGVETVWVTPTSLMTDEHWAALAESWA